MKPVKHSMDLEDKVTTVGELFFASSYPLRYFALPEAKHCWKALKGINRQLKRTDRSYLCPTLKGIVVGGRWTAHA